VFGGEYHELYTALLIQRCLDEGLEVTPANISKLLRVHLHRGIAYLSTTNFISSIEDLLSLVASGGQESQHEQDGRASHGHLFGLQRNHSDSSRSARGHGRHLQGELRQCRQSYSRVWAEG